MPLDLLDAAKSLLPDSLVTKAAMSLGETEVNIRKALKGAVPSVLAGLLHQSSRGDGPGVMDVLKSVGGSGVINNLADLFDGKRNVTSTTTGQGAGISTMIPGWLRSVFGSKLINIINAISIYADVKSSTANSVLSLAAPAALAPIAQYAEDNKLGATDIDTLLQSQKTAILGAIPAGFNLTGSLGVNSLHDIGTRIVAVEPRPSEYQRHTVKKVNTKWVWPVLLVLTFGGLIWFFSNRTGQSTETAVTTTDTTTRLAKVAPVDSSTLPQTQGKLDSLTGNYIYDPGVETELRLPDSSLLKVGKNSTEARLFKMLTDTTWSIDTADKTKNWVSFDRVYFETGKVILTNGSGVQVKNIAAILKNFPASSIKIGGYTDNSGDSLINQKISDQRAKMLMRELIKLGTQPKQINEAIGYGPEHPVCAANDTPDCKARNRRVDLKLASK